MIRIIFLVAPEARPEGSQGQVRSTQPLGRSLNPIEARRADRGQRRKLSIAPPGLAAVFFRSRGERM
jgi:hypothetical protein